METNTHVTWPTSLNDAPMKAQRQINNKYKTTQQQTPNRTINNYKQNILTPWNSSSFVQQMAKEPSTTSKDWRKTHLISQRRGQRRCRAKGVNKHSTSLAPFYINLQLSYRKCQRIKYKRDSSKRKLQWSTHWQNKKQRQPCSAQLLRCLRGSWIVQQIDTGVAILPSPCPWRHRHGASVRGWIYGCLCRRNS